jgi:signal transduction histidine kinase
VTAVADVVIILFALALIGVVFWLARRDRALSRQLARARDEEALARAETERRCVELERVTESKSRLMREFGHDVRNPLGAADGFMQLLEDGLNGPLTPPQASSVSGARRNLAQAMRLIDDLLKLARAGDQSEDRASARGRDHGDERGG